MRFSWWSRREISGFQSTLLSPLQPVSKHTVKLKTKKPSGRFRIRSKRPPTADLQTYIHSTLAGGERDTLLRPYTRNATQLRRATFGSLGSLGPDANVFSFFVFLTFPTMVQLYYVLAPVTLCNTDSGAAFGFNPNQVSVWSKVRAYHTCTIGARGNQT